MKRSVGLRCTICNHPARPQIDLAIATGLSKRAVAERFGVSRDAVWRHAQAHLTTADAMTDKPEPALETSFSHDVASKLPGAG